MKLSGATIGAGIFVVAYALPLATYSVRIIKRYPGDRGIRFGIVTFIVFMCTMAAYRLPELTGILDRVFPLLAFSILVLVCVTLFFLVKEAIIDVRRSRARSGAKYKE